MLQLIFQQERIKIIAYAFEKGGFHIYISIEKLNNIGLIK